MDALNNCHFVTNFRRGTNRAPKSSPLLPTASSATSTSKNLSSSESFAAKKDRSPIPFTPSASIRATGAFWPDPSLASPGGTWTRSLRSRRFPELILDPWRFCRWWRSRRSVTWRREARASRITRFPSGTWRWTRPPASWTIRSWQGKTCLIIFALIQIVSFRRLQQQMVSLDRVRLLLHRPTDMGTLVNRYKLQLYLNKNLLANYPS